MTALSAEESNTGKITYPWHRFWCARGGTIDLSDSGFMRDPEIYPWGVAPADPLTLEKLSSYRALILLGEPGMGKSMTLKEEHARLTQGGDSGVISIRVDLRAFSSEDLLYRRVFGSQEFLAWASGSSQMVLHLDSLDEVLLRIDSVPIFLRTNFRTIPPSGSRSELPVVQLSGPCRLWNQL